MNSRNRTAEITRALGGRGRTIMALVLAASASLALPQAAHAGDQIRLRVNNDAGFVISHLTLKADTKVRAPGSSAPTRFVTFDEREKDFPLGKSENVKWDVTNGYSRLGGLYFTYSIEASPLKGICSSKVSIGIDPETQQITNVILPDQTQISRSKLDDKVDQIIRVDFSVKGGTQDRKCTYSGYEVSKR
jgi:hypothetical protein